MIKLSKRNVNRIKAASMTIVFLLMLLSIVTLICLFREVFLIIVMLSAFAAMLYVLYEHMYEYLNEK